MSLLSTGFTSMMGVPFRLRDVAPAVVDRRLA
jgi:hypothetical protein